MVHWFDIFVVLFVLASAGWSCFRGFIREAFSLVSLIIGYVAASMFSTTLAPYFKAFIDQRHYQEMASFLLLFIVSVIIVNVIGLLIRKSLHISGAFGLADRIAGVGAGVAKGTLILALLVYPLAFIPSLQKELAGKSRVAPKLVEISEYIMVSLAPGFASTIAKGGGESKSFKEREKAAAKYRKQIQDVQTGIKDKAKQIKNRFGLAIGSDSKAVGEPENKARPEGEINESDRKELDNLINKLD